MDKLIRGFDLRSRIVRVMGTPAVVVVEEQPIPQLAICTMAWCGVVPNIQKNA